jgi:hypothetical protein
MQCRCRSNSCELVAQSGLGSLSAELCQKVISRTKAALMFHTARLMTGTASALDRWRNSVRGMCNCTLRGNAGRFGPRPSRSGPHCRCALCRYRSLRLLSCLTGPWPAQPAQPAQKLVRPSPAAASALGSSPMLDGPAPRPAPKRECLDALKKSSKRLSERRDASKKEDAILARCFLHRRLDQLFSSPICFATSAQRRQQATRRCRRARRSPKMQRSLRSWVRHYR